MVTTTFIVAFPGARTSVLGRWIEVTLEGALDERRLACKLGPRRFNRVQWLLLRLPTPFWYWGVILLAFAFADGYAIWEALWLA